MGLNILAVSIMLQLGAVVLAGMIAWTTFRRSWILIAAAILFMALRRCISFYQALLLGKAMDPVAESVALLISLLMFLGFVGLFLRERALTGATPGSGAVTLPLRVREPGVVAAFLGILIILGASVVAYYSFMASRSALVEGAIATTLRTAQSLSAVADSPNPHIGSGDRLRLVEDLWSATPVPYRGSYVCVVNAVGDVVAHTLNATQKGRNVAQDPVDGGTGEFATVGDLVAAKTDWAGWYTVAEGERQIAAFSYSEQLDALVVVNVPQNAVEWEVIRDVLPLGAGMAIILVLLLPAALGVLYGAYTRTLREVRSSEARYRAVVEDQTEFIFRSRPDGTLTFVNEAYCTCFGRARDSLLGHRFVPVMPAEDAAELRACAASLTQDKPVSVIEHRVVLPEGETRWHRWTYHAICDESGAVVEIQGIGRDITERREAQVRIERFGRIFEESLNEIYLFRADTLKFVQVNRAAQLNLGYRVNELQQLTPVDLKPRFTMESFRELLDTLRRGEREKLAFETVHRRKDRSEYDVEVHLQLLEHEEEPIYVAIILDVSARKRAQEQKAEVDARASAIIENAAEGILTIDEEQCIEGVNPAALDLFGYEEPDILGRQIQTLVPGFEPEPAGELAGVRQDGSTFPLKLSASEVRVGSKRLLTAIVRDLTRERELEQQLLRAQKMDALGTLAGGIAHDFNNILQAILGFCKVAQENDAGDGEVLTQCLDEIEAGGLRAAELVDQILTFSRQADVAYRPTLLQPLVKEALRFLRSSIPSTIEFDLQIDAACGHVLANATQMHQVVTNLCTNAMHAMEESGGTLNVSLRPTVLDESLTTLSGTIPAGDYIELIVSDTGTGIEPDVMPNLLEPFFTTKEPGKGTGLGLATVHGIVANANGGLIIESDPGKGTSARVLLPRLEDSQDITEGEAGPEAKVVKTGRVLVVDDEVSITGLLRVVLQSRGFSVDSFNDVESALRMLKQDSAQYDIAILDYTMPVKTGVMLAHDILALNPEMPVILATGELDRSKIECPPNVVELLKKPFRATTLLAVIERCV